MHWRMSLLLSCRSDTVCLSLMQNSLHSFTSAKTTDQVCCCCINCFLIVVKNSISNSSPNKETLDIVQSSNLQCFQYVGAISVASGRPTKAKLPRHWVANSTIERASTCLRNWNWTSVQTRCTTTQITSLSQDNFVIHKFNVGHIWRRHRRRAMTGHDNGPKCCGAASSYYPELSKVWCQSAGYC